MKSKKVKGAARSKAYMRKLKSNIPIEEEINLDVQNEDSTDDDSNDENFQQKAHSSSEEEVLPITDDESDSSNDEVEENSEEEEDDDLPNLDNWGKKKSTYYNADFVDKDRGKTYREEDLEIENAEREAAGTQQQTWNEWEEYESNAYSEGFERAMELISKTPIGTNEANIDDENPEAEKLKHERQKHPKFQEYKETFLKKFAEVNKLAPLLQLIGSSELDKNFVFYIKLKYQILIHYLLNLSYYLYLKNSNNIQESHPIYETIEQFKELDDKMNSKKKYLDEMNDILDNSHQIKDITSISVENTLPTSPKIKSKKRKKTSKDTGVPEKKVRFKQLETEEEREVFALYSNMKEKQENKTETNEVKEKDVENFSLEENTGDKRTITYQIAKNKGLVPKRKKECRNPRVHLRQKFRKAKIRRKGQVRGVVKEIKRYGGEPTGISAHVVRSVKLK